MNEIHGHKDELRSCNELRALADKTKFVIFALDRVKLSTVQRKEKVTGKERQSTESHRGTWDPRIQPSIHVKRSRQYSYVETVGKEVDQWSIFYGIDVLLKSTLVVDNDSQCTMYILTHSLSVPQS